MGRIGTGWCGTPSWFDRLTMRATEVAGAGIAVVSGRLFGTFEYYLKRGAYWIPAFAGMTAGWWWGGTPSWFEARFAHTSP
jgi:hypothetical protein